MTTSPRGRPERLRVLWTRGKGCGELAEMLSGAPAHRVQGDVAQACLDGRAHILVARRLPSGFDLVDTVMPMDVDPAGVEAVVAAVAGGPHSTLAAEVAWRLGSAMGVPASMVAAHQGDRDRARAMAVVEEIYPHVPEIEYRTMVAAGMGDLVANLSEQTLLVFGAPGGTWFQRNIFGAGARLRAKAPAGAVVVRSAAPKVFQWMGEPVFVGPMRQAGDTLHLHREETLAVADDGRLVGIVRRSRLTGLRPETAVGEAMEAAISIRRHEPLEAARPLRPVFGLDPIPVTDDEEHLVGGLSPSAA